MRAIDAEVIGELRAGRLAGPFSAPPFDFTRVSPMAVVPKSDGGDRIIDDLSYGPQAVNKFIDPSFIPVRYPSFRDAARLVSKLGSGCFMAKIDWKAAFRQIAVRPQDWPLLGLSWRGSLFYRLVLPFGARSSPFLFCLFATALASILRNRGLDHYIFYLDDSFMVAATFEVCSEMMQLMDSLALTLGVTLHPIKRDGPSRILEFVGFGLDSASMVAFVPKRKLLKAFGLCVAIMGSAAPADNSSIPSGKEGPVVASLRDLQRLLGFLEHRSAIIRPGRVMMRVLIQFMVSLDVRRPYVSYALSPAGY
jgi:hypothetical protein